MKENRFLFNWALLTQLWFREINGFFSRTFEFVGFIHSVRWTKSTPCFSWIWTILIKSNTKMRISIHSNLLSILRHSSSINGKMINFLFLSSTCFSGDVNLVEYWRWTKLLCFSKKKFFSSRLLLIVARAV